MAKGDILQALQQNPDMLKQILGNSSMQPQAQPTGNTQNFMAGQRKTMGDMNPVNPYGFVPPNQRGPVGSNPAMGVMNQGVQIPPAVRAPQMNMPSSNPMMGGNTGVAGGKFTGYAPSGSNTGITGGMNKTYAPQPMPYIPGGKPGEYNDMGVPYGAKIGQAPNPSPIPQSPGNDFGMTQNNPYAPKMSTGTNSRPY